MARPGLPTAMTGSEGHSLVYVIEGGGLYKIGVSIHPERRLSALQSGSPVPLTLVGTIDGDANLEADLHAWFSKARRHGEWFELSEADVRWILALDDGIDDLPGDFDVA